MTTRRFTALWHAEKMPGGYVVRDGNGKRSPTSINQSISMFTSCSVFEGWLLIERTDFLGVVL
jgi:hypothetical protein